MIMPCLKLPPGLVTVLWCYAWEVMNHAWHNPDFMLSDFRLCGPCKKHAPVKKFATDIKVRQAVTSLTSLLHWDTCLCSTVLICLWWLLHRRYHMYHLLSMYHVYMEERIKLSYQCICYLTFWNSLVCWICPADRLLGCTHHCQWQG